MFYLFFCDGFHREHLPKVKYYRHSKKLLWTGWNTWGTFITVGLTKSFSFVMFILLQCNQDYPFKFTFILVMAWMGGKIYRMDEIENTANFMSCLVPV